MAAMDFQYQQAPYGAAYRPYSRSNTPEELRHQGSPIAFLIKDKATENDENDFDDVGLPIHQIARVEDEYAYNPFTRRLGAGSDVAAFIAKKNGSPTPPSYDHFFTTTNYETGEAERDERFPPIVSSQFYEPLLAQTDIHTTDGVRSRISLPAHFRKSRFTKPPNPMFGPYHYTRLMLEGGDFDNQVRWPEEHIQEDVSQPMLSKPPSRAEEYRKSYQKLSQNIAYRYPNPGRPRTREGAIGGSWRHIKEVLGHTGSQVVFVDGLVSLYDADVNKRTPRNSSAFRAALATPAYAPSRHDVSDYRNIMEADMEQQAYKPWKSLQDNIQDDKFMQENPTVLPPLEKPNSQTKYKGFYTQRHM